MHKVIQFNQKAWLKSYTDMNTKFRTETRNDFKKEFFKLMNNAVFGKTMKNVNKHRDLRLVKTDKKRSRLVSKPNYHTAKSFSDGLLAIETQKIKVKMNKPVYLQSVTNYLRLTLVSTWNSTLPEKFKSSRFFASINKIFTFAGRLGTSLVILWRLDAY